MADTKKQDLVVTLSGDRKAHDVAKDLKAAGLSVKDVLEAINIITGSGAASKVGRMRKVHGVADVSPEHPPVDIGPPGKSPS
jgi:hypothetical protein